LFTQFALRQARIISVVFSFLLDFVCRRLRLLPRFIFLLHHLSRPVAVLFVTLALLGIVSNPFTALFTSSVFLQ
jgi:hypothetical protein